MSRKDKRREAINNLYIQRHNGKSPESELDVTLINFLVDLGGVYDTLVDDMRSLTAIADNPEGANVQSKIADLSRTEGNLNRLGALCRKLLLIDLRDQGSPYNIGSRGYARSDNRRLADNARSNPDIRV